MTEFLTLTCPSCGGRLRITNDIERFACAHCGNEHIVRRGDGIVSLSPVIEGLARVQVGVDKTASELAINRLQSEIRDLVQEMNRIKDAIYHEDAQGIRTQLDNIWGTSYHRLKDTDCQTELRNITVNELERLIEQYERLSEKKSIFRSATAKRKRVLLLLKRVRSLEETLADKREELRKHRQIVSQQSRSAA